jgi:PilZ domain
MIGRTLAGWGRLLGLGKTHSAAEEERRLRGRLSCDISTTCKPTQHRETAGIPGRVKNVSMSGACLHIPVAFPPGELFGLHLPSPEGESSDILACVVRCDALDETTWVVGCTFASPLDSRELRRFDETAGEPSPSDRRGWERYPCQARATYQLVRSPESGENHPAVIVNISGGGLALQPAQSLEVGELLSIDLSHGDEYVLTALASVVRAYRDENRLVVGCNFIRELGEENLARLLG